MSCENGVLTLDDGFSEKLSRVLSDPEALKRISDIASGLGTSPQSTESPDESPASAAAQSRAPVLPPLRDERLALINALRPLVAEEKRGRMDSLAKILTVTALIKNIGGGGNVHTRFRRDQKRRDTLRAGA